MDRVTYIDKAAERECRVLKSILSEIDKQKESIIKFCWCVKASQMDMADSFGCTTFNKVSRLANIQIIAQDDVTEPMGKFDYEKTIVHELLHLKMAFLDDSGDALRDTLTHAMIDDLAVAFVKARTEKIENVKI